MFDPYEMQSDQSATLAVDNGVERFGSESLEPRLAAMTRRYPLPQAQRKARAPILDYLVTSARDQEASCDNDRIKKGYISGAWLIDYLIDCCIFIPY